MMCLQRNMLCEVSVRMMYIMICFIPLPRAHPSTERAMLVIAFHSQRPLRLGDLMKNPRNTSLSAAETETTRTQAVKNTHEWFNCFNETSAVHQLRENIANIQAPHDRQVP